MRRVFDTILRLLGCVFRFVIRSRIRAAGLLFVSISLVESGIIIRKLAWLDLEPRRMPCRLRSILDRNTPL
jgi:hypothetical protein